jgi:hypothetical protein
MIEVKRNVKMYQPSQGHVTNERSTWGQPPSAVRRRAAPLFWQPSRARSKATVELRSTGPPGVPSPRASRCPLHERDARAYTKPRRLCPRADKCAPVNINNPERKAQNIRLTDKANGPYTSWKFSRGRARM